MPPVGDGTCAETDDKILEKINSRIDLFIFIM